MRRVKRREIIWLLFLAIIPVVSSLWVAQRYDNPKETEIEVAKFGLERGGRYEIEISYRQKVSVPISLIQAREVRRIAEIRIE